MRNEIVYDAHDRNEFSIVEVFQIMDQSWHTSTFSENEFSSPLIPC